MTEPDGLLFAYLLDGEGGGRELDWEAIRAWTPGDGVLWVHLDRTGEQARQWILSDSGIDAASAQSLLVAVANRPRVQRVDDGLLAVIRGVNLNPGDEPDDMVGLHVWIDKDRIVTLRRRRVMAGTDIRDLLVAGTGPKGPSDFLVELTDRLLEPMVPIIAELEDKGDRLQSEVLARADASLRRDLHELRQDAINFRRYLAPQRDAMSRLQAEQTSWLQPGDRAFLREIADRSTRFVEDLDSLRERAAVTQDELNSFVADRMNQTMYLLTIVSALLLPPSLLTGLFGINVGGMPGVEAGWAFATVALSIPILGVIQFVVLRRLKWI